MADTIIQLRAGSTEADIQAALNGLPSGGTLVLPANATIAISKGLQVDAARRDITIDLNGSTLKQAGDTAVIWVNGRMTDPLSSQVGHDASGHVTVAYANAGSVNVGEWIKVFSDDVLPNDQGGATRLGQAMKVVGIDGNKLVLEGTLAYEDLYKTNVRVSEYQSGTVNIKNGTVQGDQTHPTWNEALVSVRSTINTHIDHVTVRDGNSMGFNFVSTVNALVTQSAAINLTDDTANGHYGYGVHSASSVGTSVNGFYAEQVRHAVDDNAVGLTATSVNASRYGADIGLTATNVVANGTTAYAFSWHSEGRFSSYSNSVVVNSFGVLGGRGTDNSFSDISGSNNQRGVLFYEYGDGDGTRITVNNINLKETLGYAYWNQNGATGNTISNSTFEVLSSRYIIAADSPTVTFTNNVLKSGAFVLDETIAGGAGNDRLLGGAGNDTIAGGAGRDYIWGGTGTDTLTGGLGQDRFVFMDANEGRDTITDFAAGASGDVVDLSVIAHHYGWSGDLFAKGYVKFVQSGSDTLLQVDTNGGGDGFVTLATLKNVSARKLVAANVSTDIVVSAYSTPAPSSSTQGSTSSSSGASPSTTTTPPGSTKTATPVASDHFADLIGYNKIIGTSGAGSLSGTVANDLLIGTAGNDKVLGGNGDDVLVGGAGADYLNGGSGKNTVSYADAHSGLTVSLATPSANTGDAAGDVYSQIQNVTGSSFNDTIGGNDKVNVLSGGAGNDTIKGFGGADTLYGGTGNDLLDGGTKNDVLLGGDGNDRLIGGDGFDVLTGGKGADVFVFDASFSASFDTITDFEMGVDKIAIANTGLVSLSDLVFEVDQSLTASSAKATILYNDVTGAILYDADGNGAQAAAKVGMVVPLTDLHLSDFILV